MTLLASHSALNFQVGGNHYKSMAIQPVLFCLVNEFNTAQSNVVKYVCRYPLKDGAADVEKAWHYCDLWLEIFEQYRLDWVKLDTRAQDLIIPVDTFIHANRFPPNVARVIELVCIAPTPTLVLEAQRVIASIVAGMIDRAPGG